MSKSKWGGVWKKTVLIALVMIVCTFTFAWDTIMNDWNTEFKDQLYQLYCYELPGNELQELNTNEPKLGSSIFFHETSCPSDSSDITLRARQSCSIESALRAQPHTDVFLLISTPILRPLQQTENVFIQQLLTYPNFKVRHITFSKYLSGTPLSKIYSTGALNSTLWPVEHSSDILRYATLYKFGGIYLDLDVLVLKSLKNLKNFAAVESKVSLGSSILGFSFDKIGREVAKDCVSELASTYNGRVWGFNGPGVITRVMEQRCGRSMISNEVKNCKGFHIYPAEYFQAISYEQPELLFQEALTMSTAARVDESLAKMSTSTRCKNPVYNIFYFKFDNSCGSLKSVIK